MNSGRFATVLHILTLLEKRPQEWLSSAVIADSIGTNPALVRKELAMLRHMGFLATREGKNGGSHLARPADQTRLSDVYRAVRQPMVLGRPNFPSEACPVGRQMNTHLETLYQESENALLASLSAKTLADFAGQFN